MKQYRPAYFDRFRCLAGACPDSCCQEWMVCVDQATAAYYRSLPGPLGHRLRQVLQEEDGQTYLEIQDGRCPMWRPDGLCRIQAELGEQALCATCRTFPRLTHDYGDFQELGLELSCPEAAAHILDTSDPAIVECTLPDQGCGDYDRQAMDLLLRSRQRLRQLLACPGSDPGMTLALALLYGCAVQGWLDGAPAGEFDLEAGEATARQMAAPADMGPIRDFFLSLEILTPRWKDRLTHPAPGPWDRRTLALARYLVDRYWLQAVSDFDVYSRIKWVIIACLLLRELGGDFAATAQLLSKEIENDAQNLDAVLDAAYDNPAFTDEKLLFLLLI